MLSVQNEGFPSLSDFFNKYIFIHVVMEADFFSLLENNSEKVKLSLNYFFKKLKISFFTRGAFLLYWISKNYVYCFPGTTLLLTIFFIKSLLCKHAHVPRIQLSVQFHLPCSLNNFHSETRSAIDFWIAVQYAISKVNCIPEQIF